MSASNADVLSSRFSYEERTLLFARARLTDDQIVLTGFGWTGWHRRTISLEDVRKVEWWTSPKKTVNFALRLRDGEMVSVWLKGAGLWKYEVEARAPALDTDAKTTKELMAPAA